MNDKTSDQLWRGACEVAGGDPVQCIIALRTQLKDMTDQFFAVSQENAVLRAPNVAAQRLLQDVQDDNAALRKELDGWRAKAEFRWKLYESNKQDIERSLEHVEMLQADNAALRISNERLNVQDKNAAEAVLGVRAEIAALRAALQFYANEWTKDYSGDLRESHLTITIWNPSDVLLNDGGHKARAALKEAKP